ncbi:MAG: hypothetical protein IJ762_07875 [Bacteroidaceae bacterium]|nr:hypothetical protein [Bacteroidaceae bacterium]
MKHALRLLHLALCLLLPASCDWRGDHYERLLAEAEEMNRHDSLFTSDSLGLALVRHYDHWWHSRNHRLRAYYMLGCAYRDMGEAPAALHYYHIATEQADTAHADSATYATLFRVYGQMAMVYEQQNMPQEELKALENVSRYALLAGDTLTYLLGYARSLDPYYVMDDTARVLRATEEANQLYLKYGYEQGAARVFPTAIYVSLLNGNYARARRYMDIFEQESGLFGENGNIASGHEHYYYSKGLYYMGVGKVDSAESYFRKLLPFGHAYESHKGLLSVYQSRKNADSIVKYAALCERALEQWEASRQSEAVIHSSAMYRYERNQNLAEREAKDARISHQVIALLFLILTILILLACLTFKQIRQHVLSQELEHRKLLEEHMEREMEYRRQCEHLLLLQREQESLCKAYNEKMMEHGLYEEDVHQKIEDKQKEIEQQREIVNAYRKETITKEGELRNEDIVVFFSDMAQGKYNGKRPTKKDWEKLVRRYRHYMPHMVARMGVARLTQREIHAALLTHLDIPATSAAILMKITPTLFSNTKQSANFKMFKEKTAQTLAQNLKKCAYFN